MEKFGINLDDWLENLDKFGSEDENKEDSLEFEDLINGNYSSIYQGIKIAFKISQDRILSFLDSEDKYTLSLSSDYFFEKVLIYEMECCMYTEELPLNIPNPKILEIQEVKKNQKIENIFEEVSQIEIEQPPKKQKDNTPVLPEQVVDAQTNITKARSSSKFRISSSKKIGLSSSKGFAINQNQKSGMRKTVSTVEFRAEGIKPIINPIGAHQRPVSNKKREKTESQILLLPFRVYNLIVKSEVSKLKQSSMNLSNMLQRWKSTVVGTFWNRNEIPWKNFCKEIHEKMGQILREYEDQQFQAVLQRLGEVEELSSLLKELSQTVKEVSILQKSDLNPSIPTIFKNLEDAVDRQSFNGITKGVNLLSRADSVAPLNNIYLSILIDFTLQKGIELFIASKFTFRMIFSPKSEVIYKHIKFWQKSLNSVRTSLKALSGRQGMVHIIPPAQKSSGITLKKIHKFCSLYIDLVSMVQQLNEGSLKELKSTLSLIPKGVGIFGEKNTLLYKTIMVRKLIF